MFKNRHNYLLLSRSRQWRLSGDLVHYKTTDDTRDLPLKKQLQKMSKQENNSGRAEEKLSIRLRQTPYELPIRLRHRQSQHISSRVRLFVNRHHGSQGSHESVRDLRNRSYAEVTTSRSFTTNPHLRLL